MFKTTAETPRRASIGTALSGAEEAGQTNKERVMKQTIGIHDFRNAFLSSSRREQFSYDALGLIFESLAELEEGTGEEIELDIVAICCDFCECTAQEAIESYSLDIDLETATDEEVAEALMEAGSPWAVAGGEGVVFGQF